MNRRPVINLFSRPRVTKRQRRNCHGCMDNLSFFLTANFEVACHIWQLSHDLLDYRLSQPKYYAVSEMLVTMGYSEKLLALGQLPCKTDVSTVNY
jgi:hypothetical protein